jgi:hypothetical protein
LNCSKTEKRAERSTGSGVVVIMALTPEDLHATSHLLEPSTEQSPVLGSHDRRAVQ